MQIADYHEEGYEQKKDFPKLFVGQVPRQVNEQELRKIFEPYGEIKEIVVLRDQNTGMHKGCAFVTYMERESADKAIDNIHEKIRLHETKRPVVVRYAGTEHAVKDHKLFVGMLAKSTDEDRVTQIFSKYGIVKEVYLMKDSASQSKGCAFVKFGSREEAEAAIADLNDIFQDEGAPKKLIVRLADNKNERIQRQMVKTSFGGFNAFNNFGGFNQSFPGQGMGGGMNMGVMNPMGGSMGGGMGMGGMNPGNPGVGMSAGGPLGGNPLFGAPNQFGGQFQNQPGFGAQGFAPQNDFGQPHMGGYQPGMPSQLQFQSPAPSGGSHQVARGPAGANLFVYNVPENFGDVDLATMFQNFGNLLSANVFRDKMTGLSKGFGFVSFDKTDDAEKAIAALDGFVLGNKRLKVSFKKSDGGPKSSFAPY